MESPSTGNARWTEVNRDQAADLWFCPFTRTTVYAATSCQAMTCLARSAQPLTHAEWQGMHPAISDQPNTFG